MKNHRINVQKSDGIRRLGFLAVPVTRELREGPQKSGAKMLVGKRILDELKEKVAKWRLVTDHSCLLPKYLRVEEFVGSKQTCK